MRRVRILGIGITCCAVALSAWALAAGLAPTERSQPQSARGTPLAAQRLEALQAQAGTVTPTDLAPAPEATWQPPLPGITPTVPELTITPTPAILQPAVLVTPSRITTVTWDLDVRLEIQRTIDSAEPLTGMAWAPTGDKLLYVTASGKLYWCNLDGTNATLLHTYDEPYRELDEQMPLGNVLFATHKGRWTGETRLPSHIDVIKFAPGQPPTIEEDQEVPFMWDVHWWRPDRASAILGLAYLDNADYVGGERLVTLDAAGHVVEERNIPYMESSALQPGGEWLAYATGLQHTNTPLFNSDPWTTYLLNMRTGQRLQVTQPEKGRDVGSWSPDGRWFLGGRGLVSADGSEWIAVPGGMGADTIYMGGDAVWSPDGRYLAFSEQGGGCEPESNPPCTPYTSKLYIVDVQERKMAEVGEGAFSPRSPGMVMRPRWSPDGSLLALMSFDPDCHIGEHCSGSRPALYFVSLTGPAGK